MLLTDPSIIEQKLKIAELAKAARLPTIFQLRENVEAGGLLSYGANINSQFYPAASYVDRILKGTKPADLPVQQPTKLELVINLKTAKALGLGVAIPVAVSAYPSEIYTAPRSWAEKAYPKLIHYNKLPKGTHFAAWEQPQFYSEEVRAGFRPLRKPT